MISHKGSILLLLLIHNSTMPMLKLFDCLKKKQKIYPTQQTEQRKINSETNLTIKKSQPNNNSIDAITNNTLLKQKMAQHCEHNKGNLSTLATLNLIRQKIKHDLTNNEEIKNITQSPQSSPITPPITPCNTPRQSLSRSSSSSDPCEQPTKILCDSPRNQNQPSSPSSNSSVSDGSTSPIDELVQQKNFYPLYPSIDPLPTEIRTTRSDVQISELTKENQQLEQKLNHGNQSEKQIKKELQESYTLLRMQRLWNTFKNDFLVACTVGLRNKAVEDTKKRNQKIRPE